MLLLEVLGLCIAAMTGRESATRQLGVGMFGYTLCILCQRQLLDQPLSTLVCAAAAQKGYVVER